MSSAVLMTNGLSLVASAAATAAEGSAVTVDIDWTVLGQMALFFVLMVVLKPVLYDPMLKLFAEREERTDKVRDRARKIDDESAEARSTFERAMADARAAADVERDKIRAEAVKTENEIMAKVRASTSKTLDDGRKAREAEVARVRQHLDTSSAELARDLAGRVLGREVQG